MKTLFICFIPVVFILCCTETKAQSTGIIFPAEKHGPIFPTEKKEPIKNIWKINPFSIVGSGRASINYERYLGKNISLDVGISASNLLSLRAHNGRDFKEFNIGMRYYLNKKKGPLEGIYISPQLTISNSTINDINFNGGYLDWRSRSTTVTANFLIGKQIISKKGLTLDIYTGLGVSYSTGHMYNYGPGGYSSNLFSRTGFNLPMGIKVGFGR